MCGIAGLLTSGNAPDSIESIIHRMVHVLRHRGPEGTGVWHDTAGGIAVGHTRLAIHDVSDAGAQPMASRSGRYIITYNGEIYNFQSLSGELSALGWSFRGGSDTEVILAAIDEWGIKKCLPKFLGMFSFGVWDRVERCLWLARDALGEKPLYYGWVGNNFVFGSELKALTEFPKWQGIINEEALKEFLTYSYIGAARSIYRDIFKLMPGTYLRIYAGGKPESFSPEGKEGEEHERPTAYWRLASVAETGREAKVESGDAAVKELNGILQSVVRDHLVSDRPTGALLSGGIDSSLVAAVAEQQSKERLRTFSIGFHERAFDESVHARRIAEYLGTAHTEVMVSGSDVLDLVPRVPMTYDEPFADPSQLPSMLIAGVAKQRVTVCLAGDGGDELFGGYNRYVFSPRIWRIAKLIPKNVRSPMAGALLKLPPAYLDSAIGYLSRVGKRREGQSGMRNVGAGVHKVARMLQHEDLLAAYNSLLKTNSTTEALMRKKLIPEKRGTIPAVEHESFLRSVLARDTLDYLPGDNLTKVDRAAMSVALEVRLPLLDRRLVEFSWKLPDQFLIQGQTSKWILRQLLDQYLPRELIERPKQGFSVPVGSWLRGPLREWAEVLLCQSKLREHEYLDATGVEELWRQHLSGRWDHGLALWSVLMYRAWEESLR